MGKDGWGDRGRGRERKREGWDYGEIKRVREVEWYRMWKGVRQKDENIASLRKFSSSVHLKQGVYVRGESAKGGGGG